MSIIENMVLGLFWGAIVGAGYYGTIYAIEYLRVTILLRRMKR